MDTDLYTAPPSGASRTAIAYDAIKRALLSGTYPLGGRLGEERLAGEIGTSRTPVREALSRLHVEGLVDRHADGGYTPAIPDMHEIVELYEVRTGLEHTALGRSGVHDLETLTALRDDWRRLADEPPEPDPSFVLVDEDFHVRLAVAAGNQSLAGILSSVNERIRSVRMHDFLTASRVDATIDQHLSIVDAVIDGDLDAASVALSEHLHESAEIVQQRAAEAIARMISGGRAHR